MATLFAAAQRAGATHKTGTYDEHTPLFLCKTQHKGAKRTFSNPLPRTFDSTINACDGRCRGTGCTKPAGIPQCPVPDSRNHFSVAIQGLATTAGGAQNTHGTQLDGNTIHIAPLPPTY